MNTYLIISKTIYKTNEILANLIQNNNNIVNYNLIENSLDEVINEARYLSLFNDEKIIVVKNANFFGTGKKEETKELEKYLEHENKNTKLIFIYDGKPDSRKKIYSLIKKNNNIYISESMTKTEIKNELLKYVTKHNYQISDQSLWYIINNTLSNIDLAINEINKIFIYYSKPCYIKHDDVINLVSRSIEENNFRLVDSIIHKDLDNIFNLLNDFRILKVEVNVILALIYREFKLMLSTLIFYNNKYSENDILKELSLASWQLDKIKMNLKLYNQKEIEEQIIKLSILDYQYKSNLINKDTLLIRYILDLCF